MKKVISFCVVVPVLGLLLSATLVVVPAYRLYLHLKQAERGAGITLRTGLWQIDVPADRVLGFAISSTAMREQGPITLLNAPGHALHLLVSLAVGRRPNWYPYALGPSVWRVLSFPVYALPAWFFLGRGLDAWFANEPLRRVDLVISLTLVGIFLTLSVGLKFGLSDAERQGQELLNWYIGGFCLWAFLMAIPLAAWIRQKSL
jgi:hypothetical protein